MACLILGQTEPRIFAIRTHPQYSDAVRDFLVATCEPETRPASVNEFTMSSASLAAAASEGVWSAATIAEELTKLSGLRVAAPAGNDETQHRRQHHQQRGRRRVLDDACLRALPPAFRDLLSEMENSSKLALVLHRRLGTASASSRAGNERRRHRPEGPQQQAPPPPEMAYYLVARSRAFLETLITHDRVIAASLCPAGGSPPTAAAKQQVAVDEEAAGVTAAAAASAAAALIFTDSDAASGAIVYKAEVRGGCLRDLRRQVQVAHGFHIDVQYDFHGDVVTPAVAGFRLRDTTELRPYQEASLERFLRGGAARNGVVVLPCGAGKTLTGVAAAAAVGRPTIVLCINELSVKQWRDQFVKWATLHKKQVSLFTGKNKEWPADVFISTYNMMTTEAVRLPDGTYSESQAWKARILDEVQRCPWGLMLLDEVHGAPAADFQRVLDRVRYHCVLGLTATLLREDGTIGSLRHLVGPKLYEANWMELTAAGHLATVHCVEVRCPTPAPYVATYANTKARAGIRTDIEALNPNKLWCTQALLHYHTVVKRPADKVIVFCDSTHAVRRYARLLGIPFMEGATKATERHNILSHFRLNPKVNAVVLSRVGDTALDIPEASVIIQVSGLFGSRRQEAQRLGRILRPKPPTLRNVAAVFYSLVSIDTEEVGYSFGRQQWLRDQGFAYRVIDAADVVAHFRKAQQPGVNGLVCVGTPKWQYHAPWAAADEQAAAEEATYDAVSRNRKSSRAEGAELAIAPPVDVPASGGGVAAAAGGSSERFMSLPLRECELLEHAFCEGEATVALGEYGTATFDAMDTPHTHAALAIDVATAAAVLEKAEAASRGAFVQTPHVHQFLRSVRQHALSSPLLVQDGAVRLRLRRGDRQHFCSIETASSPCASQQLKSFAIAAAAMQASR